MSPPLPLLADGMEDKDFPEGKGSQDSIADGEKEQLKQCFVWMPVLSVKEKLKESIVLPQMEMACIGKKFKSGLFYIILEVF